MVGVFQNAFLQPDRIYGGRGRERPRSACSPCLCAATTRSGRGCPTLPLPCLDDARSLGTSGVIELNSGSPGASTEGYGSPKVFGMRVEPRDGAC